MYLSHQLSTVVYLQYTSGNGKITTESIIDLFDMTSKKSSDLAYSLSTNDL